MNTEASPKSIENNCEVILSLSWPKFLIFVIIPYFIFSYSIAIGMNYNIKNWKHVADDLILVKSPFIIWLVFITFSYYVLSSTIRYVKSKGLIIEKFGNKVIIFNKFFYKTNEFNSSNFEYQESYGGHFFFKKDNHRTRIPKILLKEDLDINQIFEKIRS